MKLLTHKDPQCEDCKDVKDSGLLYEYCPDCKHYYFPSQAMTELHNICKEFNYEVRKT